MKKPIEGSTPQENATSRPQAQKGLKKENLDQEKRSEAQDEVADALNKDKPRDVDALMNDPNGDAMPTGIQTGATTRGSYSTDQSTGAGGYRDHRSGTFGTDDIAQPGNDEEREPDPKGKGF